jgi:16S rRNA U516 pseudouridylate synthase RsuA-like enzyme
MCKVRDGIEIDGKPVVPHEFRIVRETREGVLLSIVVHEGMNRIVRRLMETVGIPVEHLRRVRIGPLSIAGIPRGAHRALTPGEVASLLESLHIERGHGQDTAAPRSRPQTGQTAPRVRQSRARRQSNRPPVA